MLSHGLVVVWWTSSAWWEFASLSSPDYAHNCLLGFMNSRGEKNGCSNQVTIIISNIIESSFEQKGVVICMNYIYLQISDSFTMNYAEVCNALNCEGTVVIP